MTSRYFWRVTSSCPLFWAFTPSSRIWLTAVLPLDPLDAALLSLLHAASAPNPSTSAVRNRNSANRGDRRRVDAAESLVTGWFHTVDIVVIRSCGVVPPAVQREL